MRHGFGLPHTDENFFNEDLGNCMDFWSTTENNQSPDESTFEFLKVVYGEVGTQRRFTDSRRPNSDGSTTKQDAGLTRALLEAQEEPRRL